MGFYAKHPLESPPTADRNPVCARGREPDRDPKPLRGPKRRVESGYRFYSPEVGRWLSRDPAGELRTVSIHLYIFARSAPIVLHDFLGLWEQAKVVDILCKFKTGRAALDAISTEAVTVYKVQHIRYKLRLQDPKTKIWGEWEDHDLHGWTVKEPGKVVMPEKEGEEPKLLFKWKVYIPDFNCNNVRAALAIVHEAKHVAGAGEIAAFRAEGQLAIEAKDVHKQMIGFLTAQYVIKGKIDEEALAQMKKTLYDPNPHIEQKQDADGNLILDFGDKKRMKSHDWKKWCCPGLGKTTELPIQMPPLKDPLPPLPEEWLY